jgi:RNA polymerase sigma-70 factor, ECF subfamily
VAVLVTDRGPTLQSIYEEHFGYVWNSLRRLGVAERHLEDVAHDVFLVVHRQLPNYEPSRPIKPWLFGIAFRVASDHRKKKANREVLEDELHVADAAPSAEDALEQAELRALVIEALDSLDDDRRAVFVMHELDELPAPEIAEALSIPINTVYSRLRIARERFAQAVRRIEARRGRS